MATNLSLKMVKCKLVPLIAEFSEAVALQYRTWILAHIPAWHAMQIVPKAKYLGFVLGPAADFDDFVAPLAKLKAVRARLAKLKRLKAKASAKLKALDSKLEEKLYEKRPVDDGDVWVIGGWASS